MYSTPSNLKSSLTYGCSLLVSGLFSEAVFYLFISQVAHTNMVIKTLRQSVNMEFERTWPWHKLRHNCDV
jgi:hypothetical protein